MILNLSSMMRVLLFVCCLLVAANFLLSSGLIQDYMMTFVRQQCMQLSHSSTIGTLADAIELSDSEDLVFTHYLRISKIRLQNIGGHQVIKCDAFRFPAGVLVSVSADGHTCEISGVPTIPQARTEAYVIATNHRGSSLAVVPISVNAIVLRE